MTPALESVIFQAVQGLVGGRAYPLVAPPKTARPFLVTTAAGTTGSYTLASVGNADRRRMQVDVYDDASKSFDAFDALVRTVRFALESAGGRLVSSGLANESDTGLRRARLDFEFWHRPA